MELGSGKIKNIGNVKQILKKRNTINGSVLPAPVKMLTLLTKSYNAIILFLEHRYS